MKQKFLAAGILFGILAAGWYGCGPGEEKIPEGGHVKLRSTYVALSKENAGEMLKSNGFFERDLNKSGGFGNQYKLSTLPNRKTNLEETVVTDGSTGLMWQQSGSGIPLTYREAGEWLGELNKTGYAGHKDWRLPTLEEAVSLMDNKPNENYYIDPVFSRQQHSIITGDMINEFRVWAVSFNYGRIFRLSRNERDFVRPVRSVASR